MAVRQAVLVLQNGGLLMDLKLSSEYDDFRREVAEFLAKNGDKAPTQVDRSKCGRMRRDVRAGHDNAKA